LSTTQRRSLKRAAAGVSAGMLTLTGFAAIATPATAQSNFSLTRESGADRYGTAAKIATDTFGTADNVLIASGEAGHFADALAGNFLAGSKGAPVLLTAAKTLPKATSDALASLKAKNVTILGGTSAVSSDVENALKAANYTVTRSSRVARPSPASCRSRSRTPTPCRRRRPRR
jgi:putative cell wall-binding protein